MKLLADENFPRPAVTALRERGLDVSWVAETTPGASDQEVLAECIRARRTLLTFDKDFGELAYHQGLPSECGVILFRVTPQTPDEVAALAVAAMESKAFLDGLLQHRHPQEYPSAPPSTAARQRSRIPPLIAPPHPIVNVPPNPRPRSHLSQKSQPPRRSSPEISRQVWQKACS